MASHSASYRTAPACAVTIAWRGRPRTLKLGRAAGIAIIVVVPLLAVWYLGATAYLVFHDQLLASLISRQADIQYTYEDRIATLRSQLEQQTSRALIDHQMLTTTMRDLTSRGEELSARAAAIDAFVRNAGSSLPQPTGGRTASPLRLDGTDERTRDAQAAGDRRAALSDDEQSTRLAAAFSAIEARQSEDVARLREPMMRTVGRLQEALAGTGLSLSRWKLASDGVGGPFEPLPGGARELGFEQNLSLLQQAVVRQQKLKSIVDKVPLRQPLPGQLEVSSPFGARLDPFYGRAAMHTGMDLIGRYGDSVHATAAGIVSIAGTEGGYGRMVEIDHGDGLATRYAHLSEIDVAVGQRVSAGTIVGHIGSTGRSTGPHLHYETRIDGDAVNPGRFLHAGTALFPG